MVFVFSGLCLCVFLMNRALLTGCLLGCSQHLYAPFLYSLLGIAYPPGDIQCYLK